jgi:tRNA uridine 5-carboxymethylaminomethyl modification enzyme
MREKKRVVDSWVNELERCQRNGETWAEYLRRGNVGGESAGPDELRALGSEVRDEVLYRVVFKGYIDRQVREVERLQGANAVRIPSDFDFLAVKGLKRESAEKLARVRPETLGQAARISGVNPSDVSVLMIALARRGGSV